MLDGIMHGDDWYDTQEIDVYDFKGEWCKVWYLHKYRRIDRTLSEVRVGIQLPCGDGYVTWLPVFTEWFLDEPKEKTCQFNCRTAKQNWIEGYRWAALLHDPDMRDPGRSLTEEAENEWKRRQETETKSRQKRLRVQLGSRVRRDGGGSNRVSPLLGN